MDHFARRLAESLRKLQQEAGMTQKEMAKRLGMSHATLHRLQRGDHNATLRTLEELCAALGCSPGDLFEPGRLKLPPHRRMRPANRT